MKYNLVELINRCMKGEFTNIAQSGARKCFSIDDDYVLVVDKNGYKLEQQEEKARVKEIVSKLEQSGIKNVYSIVDYLVIRENIYELQRKANGQHFKQSEVKQYTVDSINRIRQKIDSLLQKGIKSDYLERELNDHIEYTKSNRYKNLIDTRKNELLRRYTIVLNMTNEQIRNFFISFLTLAENHIEIDISGDNILYNEDGFQFIDLEYNPKQTVRFQNMLNFDSDIMQLLLGTNYIREIPNEEFDECVDKMAMTLKHIIESILSMEYHQQSISIEGLEMALKTYQKIGIPVEKMIEEIKNFKKTKQHKTAKVVAYRREIECDEEQR